MNKTEKEFVENECSRCKSTNPEDCNIRKRINGEYDCSNKKIKDILIEALADNEHKRWASWQEYLHSKCIKNEDGSLTIPKELVKHWEYEINTEYEKLPENIKESDRKEVRQILRLLKTTILDNNINFIIN